MIVKVEVVLISVIHPTNKIVIIIIQIVDLKIHNHHVLILIIVIHILHKEIMILKNYLIVEVLPILKTNNVVLQMEKQIVKIIHVIK